MPIKIDLTGIPSIVAAESTAPGTALATPIITPEPLTNSLSGLVRDILDAVSSAAVVIINPKTRKVTAASGAEGTALLTNVMNTATGDPDCSITPNAGQTGRSLQWTADDMALVSMTVQQQAAINGAVAPQIQRRAVESLVAALLSAPYDSVDAAPVIAVDQINGLVRVISSNAAAIQAGIDGLANAGDRVQLALTEADTTEVGGPVLVFEGGAV